MKIIPSSQALAGFPAADLSNFTGPVTQLRLHDSPEPSPVRVSVVHFPDGACTHWHAHGEGQVLHVIEGRGEVQAEAGEIMAIGAGDIVVVPPGERHWHGAATGSSMAHLAVSIGAITWMEAPERG